MIWNWSVATKDLDRHSNVARCRAVISNANNSNGNHTMTTSHPFSLIIIICIDLRHTTCETTWVFLRMGGCHVGTSLGLPWMLRSSDKDGGGRRRLGHKGIQGQ